MPKDYSNTIIYKICCKDKNIKDIYVGHTTNFDVRLVYHKQGSKSITEKSCKLYKFINQNGGWENWDMIELEKFSCNNLTEARIKEQEYYVKLNPSLNSCPPYVDKSNYYCNICNIQLNTSKLYNKHLQSKKHNKQTNSDFNINNIHNCKLCNFSCKKNNEWERHIITKKHLYNTNNINSTNNTDNIDKKVLIPTIKEKKTYSCMCGKKYNSRQGISHHKKICSILLTKEEPKVCKCKEYVSKIYALENQIKELENKVDKQLDIICNLSQKILL